jgi:hypothetical protein
MRNRLTLALLLTFQFSFINPVFSAENYPAINLNDVDANHWAYNSLKELIETYGLKLGYPDNTFKGDNQITRYEVAALLHQVLKSISGKELKPDEQNNLDNMSKEYGAELELIKEQLEALQDQSDIHDSKIEQISDEVEILNSTVTFKPFGSLAFRSCIMSSNIFTEPQNIIKNLNGNNFQTRIGGGINGNVVNDFNYQLRILTIEQNSYNLPWLPFSSNLIRLPLYFDRYFIGFNPGALNNSEQNIQFTIGKSANFLPETELLFDEDVSFNGLSQQFSHKFPASWFREIFLGLTENVVATDGPYIKSYMLGAKVAAEIKPVEPLKIRLGTSYSNFIGSAELAKFQFSPGFLGPTSKINRLDPTNSFFKSDFNLLDAFLKITFNINEKLPLEIYADFVNNFGAVDNNQGLLVGASLGTFKEPGDLFFNYNYKRMAQDYNLAFLVQDQMGGTDVKGHEFDFGVQVATKTSLMFTLQNRSSLSTPNGSEFFILYSTIRQDF